MADMSEMLKNFSSMMEGKEIPDNIKEMLGSLTNKNSNGQGNGFSCNGSASCDEAKNDEKGSSCDVPNIDMETMIKLQKFMSAMNSTSNNSGANLLRSLKPYLNQNRQAKVDEYIKLFNIEKVLRLMYNSGGDRKNDC